MRTLINTLKSYKTKNLYQSDIWEIKNLIYEFINNNSDLIDYTRLYYILDEMKNGSEIEDLICDRVRNDWLYTLERIKTVNLDDEYYQLDGYDNIINLEDWDIENRLDQIIDELEGNWI
jgi:hypothetical protein